jgi:F-type H+-transporting ATPase subunit b
LAAQIVNFLIIFYLLKRFLYKPILKTLKKRQDEIESGLLKAEEGEKILNEAYEKEKELLTRARQESEKIINEANVRAAKISERTIEKAKQDAERILSDARILLEKEKKEAETELENKVTTIAVKILEKSLGKVLGKKEQMLLTEKAIKEIRN